MQVFSVRSTRQNIKRKEKTISHISHFTAFHEFNRKKDNILGKYHFLVMVSKMSQHQLPYKQEWAIMCFHLMLLIKFFLFSDDFRYCVVVSFSKVESFMTTR